MMVPVSFRMGGQRIRVQYTDRMDEAEDMGECVPSQRLIKISTVANKSADDVVATLMHECFHMALALSGHAEVLRKGHEEGLVLGLETMLAPLFQIRPGIATFRDIEFPWESE